MSTVGVLVVQHVVDPHCLHPRRHLARLHRADPVVARGGVEQHRRVVRIVFQQLVWREGADVLPLLRDIRISIFGDPGGAGREVGVALHIEQWHAADHRSEELRVGRQHVANEQPAVASALARKPRGRGDAAGDEIPGDRSEVLVGARTVLLECGGVPAWAEFSPTADVREHEDSAPVEPRAADDSAVFRQAGCLESAVAGEQGRVRAVEREVAGGDLEVRHARAVSRYRPVLLHVDPLGVEERGRRADHRRLNGSENAPQHRRWSGKPGRVHPELVGLVRIGVDHAHGVERRQTSER